jgi:regulator of sigma E protease
VLAILEGVVDEGAVPVEVKGEQGTARRLTIRVPESERRALTEPGTLLNGLGFSFWYPPQPVVVGELTPDFPAAAAGLALGDRVVEVNGEPVDDYLKFVNLIRARAGQATELVVLRGGQRLNFDLVPKTVVEDGRTVGKIGLGAALSDAGGFPESMQMVERYGPLGAIGPCRARDLGQERAYGALPVAHGHGRRLHQEHLRPDQHRAVRRADGD